MSEQQRPDERIAAIRERREGIPSPPWLNNTGEFVSQAGTYMAICRVNTPVVADWLRGKTVGGPPEAMQSLKEFIAHAPDDIDFLLQHITTLTAERDAAYATVSRVWKALGISTYAEAGGQEISELVAALAARYDALRTAVERNSCSDCGQVEPDVIEALRDQANAVRAHSGYDPGAAYDATADAIISALATTPADAHGLDQPISPEVQDHYERVAAEEYPPADERVQALVTAAQELLDDVYKVISGVERREGPPTWRNCRNLRDALAALEGGGKAGE